MKAVKYLAIVLAGIFLSAGCQKEFSIENGLPDGSAAGSLKDESGNCLPVTVNGKYLKDSTLTDSNYIVVQVDFSAPGSYKISTDSSNGFSFQAIGSTKDTGLQIIRLAATGKPVLAQLTNFAVAFDTSVCMFSINVTDSAITPPVTLGDYFPTTDSSNWTYTNSATSDTFNVTASHTDRNFTYNYRTFINTYGPGITDSSYYRKKNGIYYTYSNFNEFKIFDTVEKKVDYIFLKDNEPVSSTWESPELNATRNSVDGKAKIRFTIEKKDIQTTAGTAAFDSVIEVKQEYLFDQASTGVYQKVITFNLYYAKNIGFIKAETSDPFPVTLYVTKWKIY